MLRGGRQTALTLCQRRGRHLQLCLQSRRMQLPRIGARQCSSQLRLCLGLRQLQRRNTIRRIGSTTAGSCGLNGVMHRCQHASIAALHRLC